MEEEAQFGKRVRTISVTVYGSTCQAISVGGLERRYKGNVGIA